MTKKKNDDNQYLGNQRLAYITFALVAIAIVVIYAFTKIPIQNFQSLALKEPDQNPTLEVTCGDIQQIDSSVRFTIEYTYQGQVVSQTFSFGWPDGTFSETECGEVVDSIYLGKIGINFAEISDRVADGVKSYLSEHNVSWKKVAMWILKLWAP